MEVVEFIKQKERMCDYHCGKACTHDDSGEICPAYYINCDTMTDQPEQLVEIVEQWAKEHPEETEQERQKPEHPEKSGAEESSDLYATIASLEDRLSKLETTVGNESLILRELSKRNYNTHKELADRIAALEKYPVESTPEPKRTNKDVPLAAFPNARMYDDGIPEVCPFELDKHYECGKFAKCSECKCAHWLAESEEK